MTAVDTTTVEKAHSARRAARLMVQASIGGSDTRMLEIARELLTAASDAFDQTTLNVHAASAHRELAEVLVEIGVRRDDNRSVAAALPHFDRAIRGYERAELGARSSSTRRRVQWTRQLLATN
ncbi:MAG: hypothetical protein ACOYNI_11240 [Acidimicrobiia bacterium]